MQRLNSYGNDENQKSQLFFFNDEMLYVCKYKLVCHKCEKDYKNKKLHLQITKVTASLGCYRENTKCKHRWKKNEK